MRPDELSLSGIELRENLRERNPQGFCDDHRFFVGDASYLRLDFGYGILTYIPARPGATRCKHRLSHLPLIADLSDDRANNVLWRCLAHFAGLTLFGITLAFIPISEFVSLPGLIMRLKKVTWLTPLFLLQIITPYVVFAAPRPLSPPWPSLGALHREGFDQPYGFATNQLIDPTVWTEGWSGYALQRQGKQVRPWAVPMVVSNSFQVEPERGAIRLWYRPDFDSGAGPGQPATLLSLATAKAKTELIWWSLVLTPKGNEIHLVCQTEQGPESCLQAEVNWETGSWHLLTLGFTPTNSALFIDDQLMAVGAGLATIPKEVAPFTRLTIGSDASGELPAQGQIEELAVFSGRRSMRIQQVIGNLFGLSVDWDIGLYYAALSKTAALGPISDAEIAARQAQAAKRKAEREALGLTEEAGSAMLLRMAGPSVDCVTSGPVYLTNVVCSFTTNDGWQLCFDIMGGENDPSPYDLFSTPALLGNDVTNSIWTWLETGNACETHCFTNQATNQMFYILTIPGADRDGDGLYDGWEWKHFGALNQTAVGDYDGDGVSNGEAYTNYANPNLIQFALDFGTARVNGNTAAGQVAVWQGVPEQMAVMVNDTNFAAAVWQPVQTNLSVPLGAGDGDYEVWVGLRGHVWNEESVWRGVTVTRDTVPPVLVVTNSVIGVTSQPRVQLQGYANEPLSFVRYDLTNASGLQTNLAGNITHQSLDTNTLRFTTNWFQGYDVTLATNLNIITVRVADLAGNVTTTNLDLVLDFSGDTNAPNITVTWPEANALLAGTNFMLRGQVDDATANLVVILEAIPYPCSVDREGRFVVTDVPLAFPTNVVAVIATDAAGNARTNFLTVRQSSETLTINPIFPEGLTQPTVMVSGTVGTSGQNVWVNGVAAVVTGNTWTAEVPTPAGGQAQFDVTTGASLGAAVGAQSVVTTKPPVVQATGYYEKFTLTSGGFVIDTERRLHYEREQRWVWQQGGQSRQSYQNSVFPERNCVSTVAWPGEWPEGASFDGEMTCQPEPYSELGVAAWQNSAVRAGQSGEYDDLDSGHVTYAKSQQRTVQTTVTLAVNGNSAAEATRLIRLTASAAAYSYMPQEPDSPVWMGGNFMLPGDVPLPVSSLKLFGQTLTPTATNAAVGELFLTRPMGATETIPVAVTSADNYSFAIQAEEVSAILLVDANRDSVIDESDRAAISASNPFRFWINDDTDDGDTEGNDIPGQTDIDHTLMDLPMYADYHTAVGSVNYEGYGVVDGTRDLIDFFPVYLDLTNLLALLPPSETVQYKLRQPNEAVNVVFTGLNRANALDFQTDYDLAQDVVARNTRKVTSTGLELPAEFLDGIAHGTNGVILVEGRAATIHPLELVVEKEGVTVVTLALPLRIGGVELMFRHLNLRAGPNAPANLPGPLEGDVGYTSRMGEPVNNPDNASNGRWLLFVHGYNVNAGSSRGWEAESFKRFYWSGNKAKFVGVDWRGDPKGDHNVANRFTADYHLAVMNAFASAQKLAEIMNSLAGSKTIVGHSLGCGVTAFALKDFSMQVDHACLVDAALACECFDGDSAERIDLMAYEPWIQSGDPTVPNYPRELWAADWYKRFLGSSDARQTLTWNSRFTDLLPKIHNFYSSTEDVLASLPGTPNGTIIYNVLNLTFSSYAWVVQEKAKGNAASLLGITLTGTDYGGWGFNIMDGYLSEYPKWYVPINGNRRMKTPAEIGTVTQTLLDGSRYNPLFKSGWGAFELNNPENESVVTDQQYYTGPSWIFALYQAGATGHTIASDPVKRAQFLAQAVPAVSPPVGAQPIASLAQGRNYDMPVLYAAVPWPRGPAEGTEMPEWRHSDLREVAFLYTSALFKTIVNISNQ